MRNLRFIHFINCSKRSFAVIGICFVLSFIALHHSNSSQSVNQTPVNQDEETEDVSKELQIHRKHVAAELNHKHHKVIHLPKLSTREVIENIEIEVPIPTLQIENIIKNEEANTEVNLVIKPKRNVQKLQEEKKNKNLHVDSNIADEVGVNILPTFQAENVIENKAATADLNPVIKPNNLKQKLQEEKKWKNIHVDPNIPDDVGVNIISKNYPNFPIKYWKKVEHERDEMHLSNSSCAQFPDMYDLDVFNTYWQTVHLANDTLIQLYSAYYDDRQIYPGKDVRVLAMVNRTLSNFPVNRTLFCHMWFKNEKKPVIVSMNKIDYMWIEYWGNHEDGMLGPYLLGCSIPPCHKNKIPEVVSIVEKPCDNARNMLRVVYEKPEKKNEFAICVKGLDFFQNDLSPRLIEWIEFQLLMGVSKIYFYQLEVHPSLRKVLNYYSNLGKADVRVITLPTGNANIPLLQHVFLVENNAIQCLTEIIPYNDCFYRNLYTHEYVALLDIDEIILPLKDENWHELIERTKKYEDPNTVFSAFTARHILFADTMQKEGPYPDVPPYMHMLQHVYRSQNFTNPGEFVKTISSTNYTISCHNHWPIEVAPGSSNPEFRLDDARMQHYRSDCSSDMDCESIMKDPVKDTQLWEFKDKLISRVNNAIKEIGLFEEN